MSAMNSVFSADDFTDSFWPPPSPSPSPTSGEGMIRSPSEWAFQKLLEEISVPAGSSNSSSSATDNPIRRRPPPQNLRSETSVEILEESASANVVEIHKPQNDRLLKSDNQIRRRPPPQKLRPDSSVEIPAEETPSANIAADLIEIQKPQPDRRLAPPSSAEIDPKHYQEILKSKLQLACAAVALRVGTVKPEDSSASSSTIKQPPPIISQTQGTQMSPGVSSVSAAPSLGTQSKLDSQVKQATSGSSRDYSDDEDLDGDTETTENADPIDVKRARRMLSNRESARRSRRRKQEQMNELDTQVGQLRAEHSTLLNRLSDMNQKYDTAAVDNRILKADIETLRTKVKMAEETVKRVTGMNPLLLARPNSVPLNRTSMDCPQPNFSQSLKPVNPSVITSMIPNQRLVNEFANSTVVPLNISPVSEEIGLKNPTKVPLPQNVAALANRLPEQVNPFVATTCNAYQAVPHWNGEDRKNKPQGMK